MGFLDALFEAAKHDNAKTNDAQTDSGKRKSKWVSECPYCGATATNGYCPNCGGNEADTDFD